MPRPAAAVLRLLCVAVAVLTIPVVNAFASESTYLGQTVSDDGLTVQTQTGLIRGTIGDIGRNIRVFRGIPYAVPPVGLNRFLSPLPWTQKWEGVRNASQFGSDCPQPKNAMSDRQQSEDCLFLNVFAPPIQAAEKDPIDSHRNDNKATADSLLPVMVFFYGGSWEFGSDSFPLYNGENIIWHGNRRVLVVTLNYRLGALGYLGSHTLQSVSRDGSTGNMGIQDQRVALQWVQKNIAAFGGDPSRVLIFGESAGAGSVTNHLLMKRSNGLFSRALMESGPIAHWTAKSLELVQRQFESVARHVHCNTTNTAPADVLKCLQAARVEELLKAPAGEPGYLVDWSPCVDGVELTALPRTLAERGEFLGIRGRDVPVLFGTNLNEGTDFVSMTKQATDAEYRTYLVNRFLGNQTLANAVYGKYPPQDFKALGGATAAWWAAAKTLTDSEMVCPARRTARYLVKAGFTNTFVYHFTHEIDAVKYFLPSKGVFHGSELVFVWDIKSYVYDGVDIPLPLTYDERVLQQQFVNYWANFAATGNPNQPEVVDGVITWPAYNMTTESNIQLDLTLGVNSHLNSALCDFWDVSWP